MNQDATRGPAEKTRRDLSLSLRPKYVPALDGLRAVAVLAVLAYHSGTVLSRHPGGIGGVDVFFVLSGFVITRLLRSEISTTGSIALVQFYIRRLIRLIPALFVVVLVTSAVWILVGLARPGFFLEILGALTYLTPLTTVLLPHLQLYSHTWTLGVEEYFYLLLPPVLVLAHRLRRRPTNLIMFFVLFGGGMLIVIATARIFTEQPSSFLNYFLRAGGLFLGCAAAVFCENRRALKAPLALTLVGLVGVCFGMSIVGLPIVGGFSFLLIDISTAVLAIAFAVPDKNRLRRLFEFRVARYIGRISYELYLWHLPLLAFAGAFLGGSGYVAALVAYAATFALAVVTHHGLQPLQRSLRGRLGRRPVRS